MYVKMDSRLFADFAEIQSKDKKIAKKLNNLIQEVCRNPFDGIGKPEPLKGNLSGLWSRRIDEKNRLVYAVEEENNCIVLIQLVGHYSDH